MALPSAAAVIALRIFASSTMVMSFSLIGLTLCSLDFMGGFPVPDLNRCYLFDGIALWVQIHGDTK
jgi:hypothetical protein